MFHPNQEITMYAQDYIDRQNKIQKIESARDLTNRIAYGLVHAMLVLVFGAAFCIFGWTGANLTPNPDVIPTWLWNGTFAITAIGCLLSSGFCLFVALDNLCYRKGDNRRIFHKHR